MQPDSCLYQEAWLLQLSPHTAQKQIHFPAGLSHWLPLSCSYPGSSREQMASGRMGKSSFRRAGAPQLSQHPLGPTQHKPCPPSLCPTAPSLPAADIWDVLKLWDLTLTPLHRWIVSFITGLCALGFLEMGLTAAASL